MHTYLIFCKLKKAQKTWISFFASLKKLKKRGFHFASLKCGKHMDLIFCKPKKCSKNMDLIFRKFKKAQKTWIEFFASLKKLKKHGFNFLQS